MSLFDICNIIFPFVLLLYLKLIKLDKKNINKAILILYSLFVAIVVGTRSLMTGTDTPAYYRFYQTALIDGQELRTLNYFEPLFSLIGLLCAKLELSFTVFNIVIASITMYFFLKTVVKLNGNAFIFVVLYTVFCQHLNMMNQVRQALAMMVTLYAITFLKDGQKIQFIKWVIIAALFHLSSLVVLILLPLWNIKINKKIITVYATIGLICTFLYSVIFSIIKRYFDYGHYLDQLWRYEAFDTAAILNFAVRIVMLLFAAMFYRELYERDKNINGYYHMIIICSILQLLCIFNNAMGRITSVFFLAYMFIISEIVDNSVMFKINKKLLYPSLIIGLAVYYYIYLGAKSIDYHSVLFSS